MTKTAIDQKFERVALRFADGFLRHQYGPQGNWTWRAVRDLVDYKIWEGMPFHIERFDPVRAAWNEAWTVREELEEIRNYNRDPEKEWREHWAYKDAMMLGDLEEALAIRFCK